MFPILKSSPEQELALQSLLDQQQHENSPNYHRWLTPDEFGAVFGVAVSDIDQISSWLTRRGFTIDAIAAGRRSVTFSGTAAQVERAFHTQLHRYVRDGEQHTSNDGDISIPAAIEKVVVGVASLSDFGPKPLYTGFIGAHYLAPGDFSIIYNTQPQLTAQNAIDGTGQTIAIPGFSNVIKPQDPVIKKFRELFLPLYNANDTNVISPQTSNCTDPGPGDARAISEAYLDTEWAGAVAPGATLEYVPTKTLDCFVNYVVQNNNASVISVSYGQCESQLASGNMTLSGLWEQAASQGITVFVSAGDSGSAGCNVGSDGEATQGYGVNGLASSPYNVAVGGTQLEDDPNLGYWSSSNYSTLGSGLTYTSALGYIPEAVWNESAVGNNNLGVFGRVAVGSATAMLNRYGRRGLAFHQKIRSPSPLSRYLDVPALTGSIGICLTYHWQVQTTTAICTVNQKANATACNPRVWDRVRQ